jgi:hypothetical protein
LEKDGSVTRAPIRVDEDLNIRIKTDRGMNFDGKLEAFFDPE